MAPEPPMRTEAHGRCRLHRANPARAGPAATPAFREGRGPGARDPDRAQRDRGATHMARPRLRPRDASALPPPAGDACSTSGDLTPTECGYRLRLRCRRAALAFARRRRSLAAASRVDLASVSWASPAGATRRASRT